jgi:hypothetical protein
VEWEEAIQRPQRERAAAQREWVFCGFHEVLNVSLEKDRFLL